MDVPFEELRKEDLEKFVAWMLFSKHIEEVSDFHITLIYIYICYP